MSDASRRAAARLLASLGLAGLALGALSRASTALPELLTRPTASGTGQVEGR